MSMKEWFSKNGNRPQSAEKTTGSTSADPSPLRAKAEKVAGWLSKMAQEGALRYEVDEYVKSREFLELIGKYDPDAALRIYEAERGEEEAYEMGRQDAIDEIYKRREMPRSMRSGSGAGADMDYGRMSSEEFTRLRDRLERG